MKREREHKRASAPRMAPLAGRHVYRHAGCVRVIRAERGRRTACVHYSPTAVHALHAMRRRTICTAACCRTDCAAAHGVQRVYGCRAIMHTRSTPTSFGSDHPHAPRVPVHVPPGKWRHPRRARSLVLSLSFQRSLTRAPTASPRLDFDLRRAESDLIGVDARVSWSPGDAP